jgi:hypothetical protein
MLLATGEWAWSGACRRPGMRHVAFGHVAFLRPGVQRTRSLESAVLDPVHAIEDFAASSRNSRSQLAVYLTHDDVERPENDHIVSQLVADGDLTQTGQIDKAGCANVVAVRVRRNVRDHINPISPFGPSMRAHASPLGGISTFGILARMSPSGMESSACCKMRVLCRISRMRTMYRRSSRRCSVAAPPNRIDRRSSAARLVARQSRPRWRAGLDVSPSMPEQPPVESCQRRLSDCGRPHWRSGWLRARRSSKGSYAQLVLSSAGLAVTSAMFLAVDLQTNVLCVSAIMLLRGIALALGLVSMQATAFATITPARMGRASSLFSTQRQVAASFGVAAMATVVSLTMSSTPMGRGDALALQAGVSAFHNATAAAALIAIVGLVFALRLRDDQARVAPSSALAAEVGA